MSLFIGIDGGGTKTLSVLTDGQGNVIKTDICSASNPNDIGVERSCDVICGAARRLLEGETDSDVSIFCGIAGSINRKDEMLNILKMLFPAYNVGLESDAYILLSSELYEGDGACVICGTGSVCFVRKDAQLFRIGGWGYLLDSGGSGYDIGRDVLEAALRAHDGRGERTVLSDLVAQMSGKPVQDMISEIYDGGKAYIASFAPLAFEGAEKGDGVCESILEKNAYHIGEYLLSARGMLQDGFTAVFGGGICTHYSDVWLKLVKKTLNFDVNFRLANMPPVFGGVVEAMKLTGKSPDLQIRQNFANSYTEK